MITASGIDGKYLEFRGQPLVRQGNEIYYGDMNEKYYLFLMIMSETGDEKLGLDVPGNIMVQVLSTADNSVKQNTVVKDGLYAALDLGLAWLERANRS